MAREGTATVNGTQLYYQDSGGDGPALLFLHGFTLDHRMWRPQVEALAGRFRVVVYDARGFGRSALPSDAAPYRHCDDAAALCEHLGLARVVAVGHSIGAHQTLELALERPDLVAGWAAICPAGLVSVPFPEDLTRMFADIRAAARDTGLDAARDIWRRCLWFAPLRETPALAALFDQILADYSGWHWTHRNPVQEAVPPAAGRLAELRVPTLIVTGGRDLPYNEAVAARLRAEIPGAVSLALPRAGHIANLEDPEPVDVAVAALAAQALVAR
jgi:pimeloyl-ACP methyl ester carboxylesterase